MTRRILVQVAHLDLAASRVNRAMLERISDLPAVTIVRLYERYPDFRIDVPREQRACVDSDLIVLQHPLYWYSSPALLKEWLDRVLQRGWAYGTGGVALQGKTLLSAVSSNAEADAYSAVGKNRHTMADLLAPFRQTGYHCGMRYPPPFVFYGARLADAAAIARHAQRYRELLLAFQHGTGATDAADEIEPADRIDFT